MRKMKYILTIIMISVVIIFMMINNVEAANATISASKTEVEKGTTINITANVSSAASWALDVSTSGGNLTKSDERVGSTNSGNNENVTVKLGTFVASTSGTYTISLSGYVVDGESLNKKNVSGSIKITVTEPKQPDNPSDGNTGNNQGGNNGGTNDKPTVTEPKFTSVSKTVYATGDINLRSSWSTSSNATKVAKGTELKLTGTSTEKVNGYVWYRVTYNGQIKYVANNLITEKKPEEEKSNNTNLKTLSIENVELSPAFSADVLQYTAKITEYKEKEIKVVAEAEDAKSTVKVEGNTNIVEGENVIAVEVTAEDGTKKTYKIILTNEKEATTLGLQSLKIKDVELKGFSPDKFEYEVSFRDLEKLEIEAIANEEGAIIEISGNENLMEYGEHLITIMVSSADGTQVVTYQIKANKLEQEMQSTKNELDIKNILICGVIALIILVLIILLIVKYVKRK